MNYLNDKAHELICSNQFSEAIPFLQESLRIDKNQWNVWELLGQCYRFTNDIDKTIQSYNISIEINPNNKGVFHALGIAYQNAGSYDQSLEAFRCAHKIDPEYVMAYNSAGMTLKLMGQLDKSLHIYRVALLMLSREFCSSLINDRRNQFEFEFEFNGTELWSEPLLKALIHHSVSDNMDSFTTPTSEFAKQEKLLKSHEGLYWEDNSSEERGAVRSYLPNLFNTASIFFTQDSRYRTIIGNTSTVLKMLGMENESKIYYQEAIRLNELSRIS